MYMKGFALMPLIDWPRIHDIPHPFFDGILVWYGTPGLLFGLGGDVLLFFKEKFCHSKELGLGPDHLLTDTKLESLWKPSFSPSKFIQSFTCTSWCIFEIIYFCFEATNTCSLGFINKIIIFHISIRVCLLFVKFWTAWLYFVWASHIFMWVF